jgi:hypothetical protein
VEITEYRIEKLTDPFGILEGDRFELFLDIEVPEDDELYTDKGIYLKALYVSNDQSLRMIKYELHERATDTILEFELDEEELAIVEQFCKDRLNEAI